MHKPRTAFPTEYQHEFLKWRYVKANLCLPELDWETKVHEGPKDLENSEEILRDFILDRLRSVYQSHYKVRSDDSAQSGELDLGNELIAYVKNLYYNPHTEKISRMQYTASRIFGYASPKNLHVQLSTYQDTFGRTAGEVILKNVKKIMAAKCRQNILAKLQAASEE